MNKLIHYCRKRNKNSNQHSFEFHFIIWAEAWNYQSCPNHHTWDRSCRHEINEFKGIGIYLRQPFLHTRDIFKIKISTVLNVFVRIKIVFIIVHMLISYIWTPFYLSISFKKVFLFRHLIESLLCFLIDGHTLEM